MKVKNQWKIIFLVGLNEIIIFKIMYTCLHNRTYQMYCNDMRNTERSFLFISKKQWSLVPQKILLRVSCTYFLGVVSFFSVVYYYSISCCLLCYYKSRWNTILSSMNQDSWSGVLCIFQRWNNSIIVFVKKKKNSFCHRKAKQKNPNISKNIVSYTILPKPQIT